MAEYINKNEVLNLIMHNDKVCHYADERYENVVYATACRISDVVANMPAADVQPIKHGRWIDACCEIECSCCNTRYHDDIINMCYDWSNDKINYCPNCGAKMTKDGDTD